MKKKSWVSSENPVFQTSLFWLALLTPVALGSLLAVYITYVEGLAFSNSPGSVAVMWEYQKVPIAVASISIPFVSWVIANHRSTQLVQTIEKQEEKRLYDMYYAHSEHFTTVIGRIIVTHRWKYIEKEDLPLIHRQVYFHSVSDGSGVVAPDEKILNEIEKYLVQMSNSYSEFLKDAELLKETGEETKLDDLLIGYVDFSRSNLMTLVRNLGTRPIHNFEPISRVISAVPEIGSLYLWIKPDADFVEGYIQYTEDSATKIMAFYIKHFEVDDPENLTLDGISLHSTMRSIRSDNIV